MKFSKQKTLELFPSIPPEMTSNNKVQKLFWGFCFFKMHLRLSLQLQEFKKILKVKN